MKQNSSTKANSNEFLKPFIKTGYLLKKTLNYKLVFLVLIGLIGCNSQNNYRGDFKHGLWMEYLDSKDNEVSIENANSYRIVKYNKGVPEGLVINYTMSGKIQGEYYLISSPYTKSNKRPIDKYYGLYKEIDTLSNQICLFVYFDNKGLIDLKQTFSKGFTQIEKDERFVKSDYIKEDPLHINAFSLLYQTDSLGLIDNINKATIEVIKDSPDTYTLLGSFLRSLRIVQTLENTYLLNNQDNNSSDQYNSGYQGNSSTTTQQSNKKKCYHCNGTGRCPVCSVPQTVRYKKGEQPKDHKETRGGMVVCPQCGGNGMNWGHDENRACYLCNGTGWVKCPECNVGDGDHIGQCRKCKGSGIEY